MSDQVVSFSCECTPVVESRFGDERSRSPSTAIIDAVAAAENVAPAELAPLYDEIDPETVDKLFAHGTHDSASPTLLRTTVAGWNVFVRGDGTVRVCDPDRLTDPEPVFDKALSD